MIPQYNSPPADAADPNAIAWNTGVGVANWQKYGIDLRDTLKLLRGVAVVTAGNTGPNRSIKDAFDDLNSIAQSLTSIDATLKQIVDGPLRGAH